VTSQIDEGELAEALIPRQSRRCLDRFLEDLRDERRQYVYRVEAFQSKPTAHFPTGRVALDDLYELGYRYINPLNNLYHDERMKHWRANGRDTRLFDETIVEIDHYVGLLTRRGIYFFLTAQHAIFCQHDWTCWVKSASTVDQYRENIYLLTRCEYNNVIPHAHWFPDLLTNGYAAAALSLTRCEPSRASEDAAERIPPKYIQIWIDNEWNALNIESWNRIVHHIKNGSIIGLLGNRNAE
jgi:hypothetical protein